MLEKEKALGLFCRDYTKKRGPKWGLRGPPPPLLHIQRILSASKRQERFSNVGVDRVLQKPFDVPFSIWGSRERLRAFGCAAKNNKRGGSCVQEESSKQRRLAQKGNQNQRRRASELEVPLNKMTRVKVLDTTHSGKPLMPKRFATPPAAANTRPVRWKFFQRIQL